MQWPEYISVAERKNRVAKRVAKLRKKGQDLNPVICQGRKIARTFWGESWCKNLEQYSDYKNRLPRGRSYLRHGSVLDLRILEGTVTALVYGQELYDVNITFKTLPNAKWDKISAQCSTEIGSIIELLGGKLSDNVIRIITRRGEGLFPHPSEIKMDCNCPDWATMCKHVSATLYGIGVRLDEDPALFFKLRGKDYNELVGKASERIAGDGDSDPDTNDIGDLSEIFGIEMDDGQEKKSPKVTAKKTNKKVKVKKKTAKKSKKKKPAKKGTRSKAAKKSKSKSKKKNSKAVKK
jgi:uncharacterized Zn finger protein